MAKLSDENFENLLTVLSPYILESLETIIPFDEKTDEQREEIVKAALKATEVSAFITASMFEGETLNIEKLLKAKDHVINGDFESANLTVNQ